MERGKDQAGEGRWEAWMEGKNKEKDGGKHGCRKRTREGMKKIWKEG